LRLAYSDAVNISDLSVRHAQIPLRETFRTAVRETNTIDTIEVVLHLSDGSTTVGCCSATPAITGDSVESISEFVRTSAATELIGQNVGSAEAVSARIDAIQAFATRSSSGVAAIDHALRALRSTSLPLGVSPTRASSVRTSVTLSAGSTEDMLVSALRRLDDGFSVIKAKLGREPQTDAKRMIALARELKGRATFWVDANQGWTLDETLRILDEASDADGLPSLLEQPVPAAEIDHLGTIGRRAPMPVAADESARHLNDIDRIAAVGGVSIINVKFMKFGGRSGAEAAVDRARYHDLSVLVGSMMEHPVSVAEAVMFAATLPEPVHDLDAGWWAVDPSPLVYQDGIVSVARR
jgi:L-Ala-D/L-Glu epimerase